MSVTMVTATTIYTCTVHIFLIDKTLIDRLTYLRHADDRMFAERECVVTYYYVVIGLFMSYLMLIKLTDEKTTDV